MDWIGRSILLVKFIYSEKATKFCKTSTVDLTVTTLTNVRWRFHKILWPSQNILTLAQKAILLNL